MCETTFRDLRRVAVFGAVLLILAPALLTAQTEAPRAQNVILFIGDGMDDHQIAIARNYLEGPGGALSFERLAERGAALVLTVLEDDPSTPEFVADSANSATALATGVVTSRGRISTTAGADEDVTTILELAQAAGKKVGLVATSSITDATPAVFAAHTRVRYCEGPNDMKGSMGGVLPGCPQDLKSAGGLGSISEQLVDKRVDVLLGGGTEHFEQRAEDGEIVLERARAAGLRIVEDRKTLLSTTPGAPVLGLFDTDTLPVAWIGDSNRSAVPTEGDLEPFGCTANPAFDLIPRLAEMTEKAIELLSAGDDGFFLMVESASIDKQAHAANPCGQIGETKQLEDAVDVAMEFVANSPDTLVLVTADHGHSGQIIPYPSLFASMGSFMGPHLPRGKAALLEMPKGGQMAVNYGTNQGRLEEHTGTHVPIFAQGPGAERVRGLIRQQDVFVILRDVLLGTSDTD